MQIIEEIVRGIFLFFCFFTFSQPSQPVAALSVRIGAYLITLVFGFWA